MWSLALVGAIVVGVVGTARHVDPFAFFSSLIVLRSGDRVKLDEGKPIVRMLPSREREIGIFVATPIAVGGDRLIEWGRQVEQLQKGPYVSAIRRFSDPPRLEDLDGLTLDEKDFEDIRTCRPGNCGLKLSHDEMTGLRSAIAPSGDWRAAVEERFRRVMLARVTSYLKQGHAASAYHDKKNAASLQSAFETLAQSFGSLSIGDAELIDHLKRYPRSVRPNLESFMYWSRETLGARPIISITHALVQRGDAPGQPEALVVSKRVYASHYVTASLGITAITRATSTAPRYLVYVNRTAVDFIDGFFGSFIRPIVRRRVLTEAPAAVRALRHRLEEGGPPRNPSRRGK
jgi:hypothetical protein